MLIYVKIFKIIQILRYFTGGCQDAHFTQPVNIFEIEQKICTLEQNIEFQKKPHPMKKLHVQQGKHKPNSQSVFHFLSLHVCNLVHKLSMEFTTLNYLMYLTTLRPHCTYILEHF